MWHDGSHFDPSRNPLQLDQPGLLANDVIAVRTASEIGWIMMAYLPQHPGYWLANDGNWYPNSMYPGYWLANDGNWYPNYAPPGYAFTNAGSAKINRMAIVALVAGIVAMSVVLIPEHVRAAMGRPLWMTVSVLTSIASLTGTVAGIVALTQIRKTRERGKAQALIGLIPCLFVLAVEVVVIAIYVFGFILMGGAGGVPA